MSSQVCGSLCACLSVCVCACACACIRMEVSRLVWAHSRCLAMREQHPLMYVYRRRQGEFIWSGARSPRVNVQGASPSCLRFPPITAIDPSTAVVFSAAAHSSLSPPPRPLAPPPHPPVAPRVFKSVRVCAGIVYVKTPICMHASLCLARAASRLHPFADITCTCVHCV